MRSRRKGLLKKLFQFRKVIFINVIFILLIVFTIPLLNKNEREEKVILPAPPVPPVEENYIAPIGPIRIIVPKAKIDASIEPVGITKSGNMAVPRSYTRAGWYKYGAEPGETGSAVIAGHLDNGGGKPGVFYNIKDLTPGDDIFVINQDGEEVRFVVNEVRTVDYTSAPLEEIFGTTTSSKLTLITCDGIWIPEKKQYSERLLVFAELPMGPIGEITQDKDL